MQYLSRLEELSKLPTVAPGSEHEAAAVERFKDFFSVLSEENVKSKIDRVYAADAYLNDTLKESEGVEQIREYFIESARAVHECRVDVADWTRSDGDYYFRWIMTIRFKRFGGGRETRSIGVSHVRFDAEGRVALHQDYWDAASGLFEHIPLVGGLIRLIKRRL